MWYIVLSIVFYLLGVASVYVWMYCAMGYQFTPSTVSKPVVRHELVKVVKGKHVSLSPKRFLKDDEHPTLVARHETQETGILHMVRTIEN